MYAILFFVALTQLQELLSFADNFKFDRRPEGSIMGSIKLARFTFFLKKKTNSGYLQGVIFERKAVPKSCLPNEQKEAQTGSHP